MKQKELMKKLGVMLLGTAMIVSTFPQLAISVSAADTTNELPTVEQFATVEELKSFNTDDTKDGIQNPAKISFGWNNETDKSQQWWIAGSQNGKGLILFAASPLVEDATFNLSTQDKEYEGQTVHANHYKASEIRETIKGLETSCFTGIEQGLMKETTIHTPDTVSNRVYSTSDKLYLAYGKEGDDYVTVGTNGADDKLQTLNNGLRVDRNYWGEEFFWLRTPVLFTNNQVLAAKLDHKVGPDNISYDQALVPAFELNLESVNFASAAPAASSTGALASQDTAADGAYTLRYQPQNDIGNATISHSKQSAKITGVTNDNTFLVCQNKDGAWAKRVADNDEILPKAIHSSLTSFENCNVWLETTDTTNRITYAVLATEEQGYDVNVVASEGLTVTNGVQGVVQGSTITDITVAVADGYYLPEDYMNTFQGQLNGLTATKTDTGFTISGTPTNDVNITLPAATPKAEQATPPAVTGGTGSTINGTTTAMEYASSETASTWTTCADGSTEVGAGTWYVRFKETDTQKASPATQVVVTAPTDPGTPGTPDKPNKDQPNTDRPNTEQSGNRSESAKTGDRANPLLWGGLLLGSSTLLLCSLYRKKRSGNK